MKKKVLSIVITVLVLLLAMFSFTACGEIDENTNLVKNGAFEDFNDSKFDNWTVFDESKGTYEKVSPAEKENNAKGDGFNFGKGILKLKNDKTENFVSISQTIKVKKDQVYKLSISWRYEVEYDKPAKTTKGYLQLNDGATKISHKDGINEKWNTTEVYIKSKSRDLKLEVLLGTKDAKEKGNLYVDNISLTAVKNPPAGTTVTTVAKTSRGSAKYNIKSQSGTILIVFASLITVALVIAGSVLARRAYSKKDVFEDFTTAKIAKNNPVMAAHLDKYQFIYIGVIIAVCALLLRFILLFTTYGFGKEMTSTIETARSIAKTSDLTKFYSNNKNSTAAPGFLYLLSILGAFGIKSNSDLSIMIRFINILFDIGIVLTLYFYGRKYVGNKLSTIYSSLYALLPIAFIMSAMSNTFLSVLIAFILMLTLLLLEKKYIAFYAMLSLAIIFDLRVMAAVPVLAVVMVFDYIKDDASIAKFTKNRAVMVFGILVTLVMLYLLTLPIAITQIKGKDAFYGYKAIANVMINNKIFVLNGLNLYALAGMNGQEVLKSTVILNIIFIIVFEIFVISMFIGKKNKLDVLLLIALTYSVMGILTMKVDYTYIVIPIAILMLHTMIVGDKRLYFINAVFMFLSVVNLTQMINVSQFIGGKTSAIAQNQLVAFEERDPFLIFFSVVALLTLLYYMYVSYSITVSKKVVDIKPMNENLFKYIKNKFIMLNRYFKEKKIAKQAAK